MGQTNKHEDLNLMFDKPIGASPRAGAVCFFGGGRGRFGKKGVAPRATDFQEKILRKLTYMYSYLFIYFINKRLRENK
jgi:hypothetical protein